MRTGATFIELVLSLSLLGIIASIGVLRTAEILDRVAVHSAANELAASFGAARQFALHRARRCAVRLDPARAVATVHTDADTLMVRRLGAVHGVTLTATRDSMAYSANGLGYGASNLQVIIRRGTAADTLFVSRLGRVRR